MNDLYNFELEGAAGDLVLSPSDDELMVALFGGTVSHLVDGAALLLVRELIRWVATWGEDTHIHETLTWKCEKNGSI